VLSVAKLQSGYGRSQVLFDVELEIGDGEVVTLLGRNGMGKTTTVKSIMGLVRPMSGEVRFTGRDVPATGFSIGVSRLMSALKNLGKLEGSETLPPVLVTVMDGDADAMASYQAMTQQLRQAGIRAEMYQGNWKKFGNQLKYADKRGCPLAIIQGSDERANGEIQIKDLIEGKRLSGEITDNVTWRESRPAQVTVAAGELVETVKRMLAGQAEDRARAAS